MATPQCSKRCAPARSSKLLTLPANFNNKSNPNPAPMHLDDFRFENFRNIAWIAAGVVILWGLY